MTERELSNERNRFEDWHRKTFGDPYELEKKWGPETIEYAWEAWNAARRWISVKDRLPEKSGGVLIFDYGCENAFYDAPSNRWETESTFNAKPTHWQPLPPPPEALDAN